MHRTIDQSQEIVNGILCYFNKVLPVMLLYKKERQQYIEAVVGDVSPSATYGAEHLLRLFGMLPDTWFCHLSSIYHLSSYVKPVEVIAIENKFSHIMAEKNLFHNLMCMLSFQLSCLTWWEKWKWKRRRIFAWSRNWTTFSSKGTCL